METISSITMSLPDTLSISVTPQGMIFNSSPAVTTDYDVALTYEITSSILLIIGVIGIIIVLCIALISISKYKEQKLRLEFEEKKRMEDKAMQEWRNKTDSASRYLSDFYKKKESEVSNIEKKMAEASCEFLVRAFKETHDNI